MRKALVHPKEGFPVKKPQMVLFDYGQTLCAEIGWSAERGNRAMLERAVRNPGWSLEEVSKRSQALTAEIQSRVRTGGIGGLEIPSQSFQRLLYGSLGIEFDMSPLEMEEVFWNGCSDCAAMPGAAEMLEGLHARGIRTGVISNLSFSGEALRRRLNRFLPDNHFELVMASSDYAVRKPDKRLFQIALVKAGLAAEDVWYCGDNTVADVGGAAGAGLFPVWYTSDSETGYVRKAEYSTPPECEYLRVRRWDQLIKTIDSLEK